MHEDPALWSVEEVQYFFRHKAAKLLPKFSEHFKNRANQTKLNEVIEANQLDGETLFQEVDKVFIRKQHFETTPIEIGFRKCVDELRRISSQLNQASTPIKPIADFTAVSEPPRAQSATSHESRLLQTQPHRLSTIPDATPLEHKAAFQLALDRQQSWLEALGSTDTSDTPSSGAVDSPVPSSSLLLSDHPSTRATEERSSEEPLPRKPTIRQPVVNTDIDTSSAPPKKVKRLHLGQLKTALSDDQTPNGEPPAKKQKRSEPQLLLTQSLSSDVFGGGPPKKKQKRLQPQLLLSEPLTGETLNKQSSAVEAGVVSPLSAQPQSSKQEIAPKPVQSNQDRPDSTLSLAPAQQQSYVRPALDINDVFYGEVKAGSVVSFTEHDEDGYEFDYTLNHGLFQHPHAQFVAKRMRHFLRHQTVSKTMVDGDLASCLAPYPLRLSTRPSVTRFSIDSHGEVSATREHVIPTNAGFSIVGADKHSPDNEFAHLLTKYGGGEDDELLPLLESADGQTASEGMYDDLDDESGSDMAEVSDNEEEDAPLSRQEIMSYFEDAEREICNEWRLSQLPKLEHKEAFSIWSKQKGSRTLQKMLIDSAEADIKRFQGRLTEAYEYLSRETCHDVSELKPVVLNLTATIEDKMKAEWKIEVYNRRRPPKPPSRAQKLTSSTSSKTSSKLRTSLPFSTHPDDRLSISPEPMDHDSVDHLPINDETMSDLPIPPRDELTMDSADRLQAAFNIDTDMLDDFVVPDEDKAPNTKQDSDEIRVTTPRKKISHVSNSTDDPGIALTPVRQSGRDVIEITSDTESDNVATPGLVKLKVTTPAKTRSPAQKMSDNESDDAATPGLVKLKVTTPVKVRSPPQRSTPTKPAAKTRPKASQSRSIKQPRDLTSAEVEQLNIDELIRKKDRIRLLIKLLHMGGPEYRQRLYDDMLPPSTTYDKLNNCLTQLLDVLKRSTRPAKASKIEMYDCAGLCLAWFYLRAETRAVEYDAEDIKQLIAENHQLSNFLKVLNEYLMLRDAKMFKTPPRSLAQKSKTFLVLSSEDELDDKTKDRLKEDSEDDDDDDSIVVASRRKNPKKVVKNQAAQAKRQAAHARQQKHLESQAIVNSSQVLGNIDASSVVVNPEQVAEGQPAVYINQEIAEDIKPHQIEGVQFLWRELTNDHDDINGCLLAHTMGLGKTMQTITILVILTETLRSEDKDTRSLLPPHLFSKKEDDQLRALILCPPSLIENWRNEIKQWDHGRALGQVLSLDTSNRNEELHRIEAWAADGGVMLVSYQKFTSRVGCIEAPTDSNKPASPLDLELHDLLLNTANVVALDEAQAIKSAKSKTNQMVNKLKAKSRIALSGTPLSNAIDEVYELISFVSPGYLSDRGEFNGRFAIPIRAGLFRDATYAAHRRAIKQLKVLRADVEPKCQRKDIKVLADFLTTKIEFMITLNASDQQKAAYRRFTKALRDNKVPDEKTIKSSIFSWLQTLSLLLSHPSAFRKKLLSLKPVAKKTKKQREQDDDDEDDDVLEDSANEDSEMVESPEPSVSLSGLLSHSFTKEIAEKVIGDLDDSIDANLSCKSAILLEIVRKSIHAGDKILVFSHFIPTIRYLERLLNSMNIKHGTITGSMQVPDRLKALENLKGDKFDVMLVSTRAGGLGLNMQCASRVIIFDSGFNPTHEQQAIGRAYRYGQEKPVFVYHLKAGGTFEDNMQNTQGIKTTLAQRVVDGQDYVRRAQSEMDEWLYDPRTPVEEDIAQWADKDPGVMDEIIKAQLAGSTSSSGAARIYSMHTTETFEKDATDETLNDEEMQEVKTLIAQAQNVRRSARLRQTTLTSNAPLLDQSGDKLNGQPAYQRGEES